MEAVFLKIVNMSLTASWLVLAILLLRVVFRKAPRWIFCLLWGLVAVRLICPFSIESGLSLIPSSEPLPEEIIYTATPNIDSGIPAVDDVINPILAGSMTAEEMYSANPTQIWSFILAHLWIIGVGLMILYAVFSYMFLAYRMRTATKLERGIKQSELVDSPFVLGIIRPTIYIPYQMNERDLQYVIAHERAHIKRKDHWWKPAGFLLLSVYWFNPLIWIGYILLCRDIEAACDEKVIKEMEKEELRAYSTALLNCSIHRRRIMACPIAFGEVGVKERVKGVINYKKPAFWLVGLFVICSVVIGFCLLTDPVNDVNAKVMGAEYKIEKVLYAVTVGDEVSTAPPQIYGITPDYKLYYGDGSHDGNVMLGQLEPYTLTKRELNQYMPVDEFRKNANVAKITDSYILRVEGDNFYLVFRTSRGNTYLAYGWEDVSERGQGASDDTRLRRLYQLNSYFTANSFRINYFNYFLENHLGKNAEAFAYHTSTEFEGYVALGFMANGTQLSDMRDMGFAVLEQDHYGRYRLLNLHLYEDAAVSGNGIYHCDHAAVMNTDGELRPKETFDVILSCNGNLNYIERTYIYNEDEKSPYHSKTNTVSCDEAVKYNMILFGWDMEEHALRVFQKMYDRDGNQMTEGEVKGEIAPVNVGKKLTLDEVVRQAEKGDELSWEDFENYSYRVTGSGLYIRSYEIDDEYHLLIGGSFPGNLEEGEEPEKPMYIYLIKEGMPEERVEIREGNVREFINQHKKDPLDEVIVKAILNENKGTGYEPEGSFACASFVTLARSSASGTPVEGNRNHMEEITVYGMAMYQVFEINSDRNCFLPVSGNHIPTVLTFRLQGDSYRLVEYWTPGDGAYYVEDIRDKYPDEIEEEALNTQKYVMAQTQNCFKQALVHTNFYEGYRLDDLLEEISSSPGVASNPADYIESHPMQFREILYYGDYALMHFYSQFLNESEKYDGLDYQIMAKACQQIALGYGEGILFSEQEPATGKEWFDAFKENALELKRQYSEEESKEKYHASWLLLDFLEGYY